MLMHKLSAYVCWKVAMDKNGAAQKKYSPIKQVIMYINLKTIFPPKQCHCPNTYALHCMSLWQCWAQYNAESLNYKINCFEHSQPNVGSAC